MAEASVSGAPAVAPPSVLDALEAEIRDAAAAAEAAREKAAEEADKFVKQRPAPGTAVRTQSKFSELHTLLATADAISQYIRSNIEALTKNPQVAHALLQAISGRPDALYVTLFDTYRAETLWLLDRIAGNTTLANAAGKRKKVAKKPAPKPATMHDSNLVSPYAHDFVFRAECGIVGQDASYADTAVPLSDSAPLPVLSSRELIADFFTRDPAGYIERQVQLATSPSQIVAAATRILSAANGKAVHAAEKAFIMYDPTSADSDARSSLLLQPKKTSLLLAHLLSKARRLFGHTTSASAAEGEDTAPGAILAHLTPDALAALKQMTSTTIKVCHRLCAGEAQPKVEVPAKLQHFIDFVMSNELIGEDEVTWVEELLAAVTNGVESQADSMTIVLTIKSANTRAEFRAAFDSVATIDGESVTITKTSPDVLSALGVAGMTLRAALKDSPNDEGELLCKQLVLGLTSCRVSLPRRALAFVEAERRLERQADVKRVRQEQEEEALKQPKPVQPLSARRR